MLAGALAALLPLLWQAPPVQQTPVVYVFMSPWQIETVSLSALPVTATSVSYTTIKTPMSGVLMWWYISDTLTASVPNGAAPWAGNPITFKLPSSWKPADSIVLVYQ